jgi:hypothetical protein
MSEKSGGPPATLATIPNGSAAAAILAAGISTFVFAIAALAGAKSSAMKVHLTVYKPTGPLSGVAAVAVLAWLTFWAIFEWRWSEKTVAIEGICNASLALLAVSLLLTIPAVVIRL